MSIEEKLLGAPAGGGFAGENFKAITYTGNGSTQSITGVGFKPDLVMIKPRTESDNWNIFDSTRGPKEQLLPNTGAGESTQVNSLQSFDTDGFSLGTDNNSNKDTILYSAWCWKANGGTTTSNGTGDITSTVQANTAAGFSIVKWTGNASATQTVGHGLSSAPEWMVVKNLNTGDWVWQNVVQLGAARGIYLNDSAGEVTDSTFWQSASPTSTVFTVGSSSLTNGSGNEMIAYCWHSVSEFSNSTTGSQYIGTGTSNGPIVELGFEPSIILIKSKDGSPATNWLLYTQETNEYLSVDNNNQASASAGTYKIDFLSNGFKVSGSGSGINNSGQSYNYYCWAKDPDTEVPELAASFSARTYVGTGTGLNVLGVGFQPDLLWTKDSGRTYDHMVFDSVRGPSTNLDFIYTNHISANNSGSANYVASLNSDGFTVGSENYTGANNEEYVSYSWKANDEQSVNTEGTIDSVVSVNANAGFSIVKYTGTGSNATVGHGLSATPTFILVKNLTSTSAWAVFQTSMGATKYMELNDQTAMSTASNVWNDTAPTATTVSIGTWGPVNTSTNEHIMYCFHDVTGFSKFGSYTGDGLAGKAITVGFQPDWVLIKSTVGSDNWRLYDNIRGITAGGYLEPNNSDTDNTSNAPALTTTSTGWEITSGGVSIGDNVSPNLYTYYAFRNNTAMNTTLEASFNIITYEGNGTAARAITGLGFSPDLVWMKGRSQVDNQYWQDSVRTAPVRVYSNSDVVEYAPATNRFTSFNSDGFTIGSDSSVNLDTETYVAWCWKAGQTWNSNSAGSISSVTSANTANGFSVIKYHGDSASSATIGHGLSSAPELIITKARDFAGGWPTQYNDGSTAFYGLRLNENGANDAANGNVFYANTAPTASVYTVGDGDEVNDDYDYIAYCFHSVAGFSKIGSYTGNSSTQAITGLGFKPDFVMLKETDGIDSWEVFDSLRGATSVLYPNGDNVEGTNSGVTSFDSDGFTLGSATSANESGKTYIYMSFAKNVASNTTLENSFKTVIYSGNSSSQSIGGVGFQPDLVWIKERSGTNPNALFDSERGTGKLLVSETTAAQSGNVGDLMGAFETDGFQVNRNYLVHTAYDTTNGSGSLDYVAWCWRAGGTWQSSASGSINSITNVNTANGFSIVKWTGTGANGTVGHGLSSTPEIIISKNMTTAAADGWPVYSQTIGNDYTLFFNDSSAKSSTAGTWGSTSPTSTVFTVQDNNANNQSANEIIAYCFHSVAGYSKISSYTGTGSALSITGLGFQPDFLLLKDTQSTEQWYTFDSVRGADKFLHCNLNSAEGTDATTRLTSFDSDGFSLGTDGSVNGSGNVFIYMAFKMN